MLPDYDTLGSMIVNSLGKLEQNELMRQQAKNALIKNKYAEPIAELELKQKQAENELYKPVKEAEIANKIANTNRMNFQQQNPFFGQAGAAGQLGAMELLRQNPDLIKDPNALNFLERNMQLGQQSQESMNALRNKQSAGYDWGQLTAETKNDLTALGRGMGVDPTQMKDYISRGMSIKQIAEKEGLDPNNIPAPVYVPTETTKTRVQQQQQVGAEIDYMSSALTPVIARYADSFAGVSPKKIKDMMSSDPEAQKRYGEYVGALALQNELANGRVLLSGGKSGIEIIRDLKDKTLAGLDTYAPVKMNSVSYKAAQDFMDKTLQKGAKIRTLTGMNPYSYNLEENKKTGGNLVSEAAKITKQPEKSNVMTYNPKTGRLE